MEGKVVIGKDGEEVTHCFQLDKGGQAKHRDRKGEKGKTASEIEEKEQHGFIGKKKGKRHGYPGGKRKKGEDGEDPGLPGVGRATRDLGKGEGGVFGWRKCNSGIKKKNRVGNRNRKETQKGWEEKGKGVSWGGGEIELGRFRGCRV